MSLMLKPFSEERKKLLYSRGVPRADMIHSREHFDVAENLVKYETDIPGMQSKVVSAARQFKALTSLMENPIRSSYCIGIASYPSDLLAKHLAVHVFNTAITAWQTRHKPGRSMPLWHRVFGGLNDNLRDKPIDDIPSLLVLSNINEASSGYKLEKVRDLLEKYSHVPRIVVLSGKDPITFFGTRLYWPINAGIMVGPTNRIKEL